MALIDIDSLVTQRPALYLRFRAARLQAAWDVLNEDSQTPSHTARLAWANKIIADYDADGDKEFRRFLSNTTIQASGDAATDNDVQFVVNSFVTTWAA